MTADTRSEKTRIRNWLAGQRKASEVINEEKEKILSFQTSEESFKIFLSLWEFHVNSLAFTNGSSTLRPEDLSNKIYVASVFKKLPRAQR